MTDMASYARRPSGTGATGGTTDRSGDGKAAIRQLQRALRRNERDVAQRVLELETETTKPNSSSSTASMERCSAISKMLRNFEIEELRAATEDEGLLMVSYNFLNKRVGILNSHGLWFDACSPFVGFQCSRDGKLIDNKREAVAKEDIGSIQETKMEVGRG